MKIQEKVSTLFNKLDLVAVGTVGSDGTPNVSVVFWKKIVSDDTIIMIDNFMKATKENIQKNGKICITFWDPQTEEGYKVKGIAHHHIDGPVYEDGKAFIQSKKPGRIPKGVVEVKVEEIFDITPGPNAGNKI